MFCHLNARTTLPQPDWSPHYDSSNRSKTKLELELGSSMWREKLPRSVRFSKVI